MSRMFSALKALQERAPAPPAVLRPPLASRTEPTQRDILHANIETQLSVIGMLADEAASDEAAIDALAHFASLPTLQSTASDLNRVSANAHAILTANESLLLLTPFDDEAPAERADDHDAKCESAVIGGDGHISAVNDGSISTTDNVEAAAPSGPRERIARNRRPAAIWKLSEVQPSRAYRDLATRMLRDVGSTDSSPTLLVTGVRDSAQADFNLAELASAIADAGREVLIVDAAGSVRGAIGAVAAAPACGLNQVLAGSATWREATHATNLPGIAIVGAGCVELSAGAQHFAGNESPWRALPRHDRVVLVGAPAFDRPLTLGATGFCRWTYLLVELGQERKAALAAAMSALVRAGGRLRGAIVIKPTPAAA